VAASVAHGFCLVPYRYFLRFARKRGLFALRYFRSREWKFPVGNIRSWELSFLGTFVPENFCSMELSFQERKWMGTFASSYFLLPSTFAPQRTFAPVPYYSVGLTTAVKLYSPEVDTITNQNVGLTWHVRSLKIDVGGRPIDKALSWERSLFQRGAKNTGERKFSIIFALGNENFRERKLAGAKVPRVFAPGSVLSLLGTFAPGSESTEEWKGPIFNRFCWNSQKIITTTNILNDFIFGKTGTATRKQDTIENSNWRQSVLPGCQTGADA